MNASTPPAVAPARREAMGFSLAFPLAWADIFFPTSVRCGVGCWIGIIM